MPPRMPARVHGDWQGQTQTIESGNSKRDPIQIFRDGAACRTVSLVVMAPGGIGRLTDLAPADVPLRLPALERPEFRGPLSAIVSRSGQVTELDSGAGARALRADPDLVRHATAFLETDLPDVRFAWQLERRSWMWIS